LNARTFLALALATALVASGCRPANVYEGHGIVREVDLATGQAVIEHDEIPGLMSAMTMSFDVPDKALLAQLAPGQHIDFELEVTERSYRIIAAKAEGASSGAARSPSIASALQPNDLAPAFSLVDQAGNPVTLADLNGQVLVVDFIFTRCPGPCPIMTSRHVELQRALAPELRERVRFVSISLDPAFDSPEVLKAYADARGVDLSNWSFLTGPEPDVAEVVRRFGVGTLRASDGNIDHALATFLVDGRGRIAKRWLGLEHPVDELRTEITALVSVTPPAGA
jgi:protein SCO1/2